ncbi:30S ribosomal protein S10 [Candidatus Azambacteria bacterium]|nr:30S ribosomal protein S10 [Candidatus Azambacteria bacterium]
MVNTLTNTTKEKAESKKKIVTKITEKSKETEVKQRIRIKIKSYDSKIIDNSTRQIIENIERFDAEIVGPVPLPSQIKKYTVNRSTFVHKNSREQYEIRIHQRLIDIINPSSKIIEALTNLSLPAGVDIEIKV